LPKRSTNLSALLCEDRLKCYIPLIVDLDHTLIDTDLLVESSIATLKKSPWLVALYPFWLLQGKGYLKAQLIKHISVFKCCVLRITLAGTLTKIAKFEASHTGKSRIWSPI
jgi:hypothetical protein